MENPIVAAEETRRAYEERLFEDLNRQLLQCDEGRPWVAVALAYHHGLSFGPVIGMLSDPLPENDDDALMDALNPAEWELYEEYVVISEEVSALARELEAMAAGGPIDEVPRYGREIHVRVSRRLRESLLAAGALVENGLVYATEYGQADLRANLVAANPPEALPRSLP